MIEPLVSVVMPVYNGEKFLSAAAESILRQDHGNLELIAIDDGSTDGTLDLLSKLASGDRRVRLITRENRGLIASLNEGISHSRGSLIARMDADDVATLDRISRQASVFREQPQTALCASGFIELRDEKLARCHLQHEFTDAGFRTLSVLMSPFRHPTVMFSRALLGDSLFYDPAYECAEDFELFRRICRTHKIHVIRDALLYYRIHDDSVTSTRETKMLATHFRIVSENLALLGLYEDLSSLQNINSGRCAASDIEECVLLFDRLRALQQRRPVDEGSAFGLAIENFFFVVFQMMVRRLIPMSEIHRFVMQAGFAVRMRRRELYALAFARHSPVLARVSWSALRHLDLLQERLLARPLKV